MHSSWVEADAVAAVAHYAGQGYGADVALRIYSSRLLGSDARLVQHGGGNTSLKTRDRLITGDDVAVIRVKGSGWDLGDIEPAGMPSMQLGALLALRAVDHMSDEAMVNAQRCALLDSTAPTPSVETLLHAWVPATVIDHTHANAVLALVNQADGARRAQDLYGDELAICDYVMPGFRLAHQMRAAVAAQPGRNGAILLNHGIFTWGDDVRESYERMIAMVSRAESALEAAARTRPRRAVPAKPNPGLAARLMPVLRGALATALPDGGHQRVVLARRSSEAVIDYVGNGDVERYSQSGLATPDHVLRIKPWPLVLPDPAGLAPDALDALVRDAVEAYRTRYRAYFSRHSARADRPLVALDPSPRVVLSPGVGLIASGRSRAEAAVAADVAETNVAVVSASEALGPFRSLDDADVFDVEYWSLEQAKLGKGTPRRLAGQVVLVTGGGNGIGAATARAFAAEGAVIAVADRDAEAARSVAAACQGIGFGCDVTDSAAVAAMFADLAAQVGGIDIVVSNAGAAWSGRIGEVDDAVLRASFELNFHAHQHVARNAVAVMRRQRTGGVLLFNGSKQAMNPGPDFGPYGLPKAALIALARQYALDYGKDGIRANVVNADRIRSGLLTERMIAERSAARGLSESAYMEGNLLEAEVRADDVAAAFVALALCERTTAGVLTVDGGNIAAAVR